MKPAHFILALVIMTVWGFAFVAGKIGVNQIPPIFFTGLRSTLVALFLLPFLHIPRGHIRQLLLLSVGIGTLHYSLVFVGLQNVDASLAIILVMMQAPFAVLLAVVFLGERIGWRRILGLVIAFLGILLIIGEPDMRAEILPMLLILTGIFFWAAGNVQIRHFKLMDGSMINGWIAVFMTPQIFLVSFFLESGQMAAVQAADWRAWAALFFLAGVVTVGTFALWYRLISLYPVNQVMPFTLLMPVFGVVAGVLVLDETLSLRTILGGIVTLAGVAIIVLRRPDVVEAGV